MRGRCDSQAADINHLLQVTVCHHCLLLLLLLLLLVPTGVAVMLANTQNDRR